MLEAMFWREKGDLEPGWNNQGVNEFDHRYQTLGMGY